MASEKKDHRWSRLSVSTNGRTASVHYSDMDIITLSNLFYAILDEIPHAPQVMKLVLEKYTEDHESRKPGL